jgi:hypothetical protein
MIFNRTILLFAGELIAVAILRLIFMLRRDGTLLPRGSKVPHIKGRPVIREFFGLKKRADPPSQPFTIEGWTPPPPKGKMPIPDQSPGE